MFETEAIEKANEKYPIPQVCNGIHYVTNKKYAEGFQDGAEFGYNKANEWHDLEKDPNDYPTKEQLGESFIVAFAFNKNTQKYYSFDCAEYIEKRMFLTHTINGSNENNGYKVIAWKEIE